MNGFILVSDWLAEGDAEDRHRNQRERYALVCVSSGINAEPPQPTQYPQPYALVNSHRGVGTNERTQPQETELTQPTALVCRWNAIGRLVTKCDSPEPNADGSGCANCGSAKP